MASVGNVKRAGGQQEISRKRKRTFHREIPTSTPSLTSTPGVVSQAPRGINPAEFAEARALEIQNMVEAIKDGDRTSGKRIFQTLPRHMRRRAMSHNVKRMPVRLRQRASHEMKNASSHPEVPKKKSRHQRRQPKNLLEEYSRRQRKHIWLETHIWHAKRMKMIDAWGYRLAEHPNDKGFRAAYRATKNSSLLQDISYYGCMEVSGVQSLIVEAMSHLTTQEAGLSMAAKVYIDGSKEGHIILYKMDQYPLGAIGPVSFLWRPKGRMDSATNKRNVWLLESSRTGVGIVDEIAQVNSEKKLFSDKEVMESCAKECHAILDKDSDSQLWIWSHPACYHSVFSEVVAACKCVGPTSVRDDAPRDSSVDRGSEQDARTLPLVNGHSVVSDTSGLTVTCRRFDLLRFRLTGPQSHAVLAATLQIPHDWRQTGVNNDGEHNKCDSNFKHNENDKCLSKWWQDVSNSKSNLIWDSFKKMWSPSVFPPGCVIGLCVLDPRLNLPGQKQSTSSIAEEVNSTGQTETACDFGFLMTNANGVGNVAKKKVLSFESVISQWPSSVADSAIWEESIRREVKQSKISEQELNRKRSELPVPGSQLNLSEEEISHIPVLVIQLPGCSGNSKDPGANPGYGSGWDIILPSGWAMAFWIAFVYRGARVGGLKESHTLALEQGVPFFPNDFPDTPAGESYCAELKDDGEAKYARYPPAKRPNYQKLGVKSPFSPPWKQIVEEWSTSDEVFGKMQTSLEDAHLSARESHKGLGRSFYVLRSRSSLSVLRRCFKMRCDKPGIKRFKQQATLDEMPAPVDELWSIVGNNPSCVVFVSLRMANRGIPLPNSSVSIPSRDDVEKLKKCKEYVGPVESLHKGRRPEMDEKSLKCSCQREIVGFVSSGHFSLSRGSGFAVGFCALPGLAKMLASTSFTGEAVVLVRGPASQQYRFAYLSTL